MFARANCGLSGMKGAMTVCLKWLMLFTLVVVATGGMGQKLIYGASVTQGTVKARSGYVRKSASTSDSTVFCVSSGETVAILGEEKGKDGSSWYKIAVGTSTGYIRSDLVTKTDKKINVSDSLVSTTSQESSASKNNTNSQKTEDKKTDTKAETKTDSTSASNSGQSSQLTSQTTGTAANVGVIKGTSVRLRKDASTTSAIAKVMELGAVVTILGEGKGSDGEVWYQVKTEEATGFVRADLVKKVEANNTTNSSDGNSNSSDGNNSSDASKKEQTSTITVEEESVSGKGTVKGTSVRIRGVAGLEGNIITTVSTGESLVVTGKETGPDRNWYRVEFERENMTLVGYIAAEFVDFVPDEQPKEEEKVVEENTQTEAKNEEEQKNTTTDNTAQQTVEAGDSASIKGVGVRVRELPVTGNVVCQLSTGHPLEITGEADADDGHKWYQVKFSYQGSERSGYVRSDFVTVTKQITEIAPLGDEEFEASIAALPDSYKNSLRALHVSHPAWRFETVDTGLEWSDALTKESSVGKNLVSKNSIASWKSTAAQAYNWSNNSWYTFDGGSWASASSELIAYYMDPRNFLTESGIYQFENLDYSDTQKEEGVSKMLSGTFMSGSFTDADGAELTYAGVFSLVGKMVGVSPYLLAGRALQEQGIYGKSNSIAGNVPGYEGYYNYYNIGAYAYSGRTATTNGLIYAKGTDDESARPWNTRAKSIYGGAKYISEKYVAKGQNTLYFQKFNVVNSENGIYSHQYMSNIQAASSESARLQLAYLGDDEALVFRIPFYRNMPSSPCTKPTSDSNPNTYLGSLSVGGYELTPKFSGNTENYVVNVDKDTQFVTIEASAVCASSAVGGAGTFELKEGTNIFTVGCKAQNGAVRTYKITVQK